MERKLVSAERVVLFMEGRKPEHWPIPRAVALAAAQRATRDQESNHHLAWEKKRRRAHATS